MAARKKQEEAPPQELTLPKGERSWVGYYNLAGERLFLLTSKQNSREWYFLYEVHGATLKKLGKAHSPTELEEKFQVMEKIRASRLNP